MKVVNGYKVYEQKELVYRGFDEKNPAKGLQCWFSPDGELMAMGATYHGGYRTAKDVQSDREYMDSLTEKKPIFYGDELCGWILYGLFMFFGNIFIGFFPFGMIGATILFCWWRSDYRKQFGD